MLCVLLLLFLHSPFMLHRTFLFNFFRYMLAYFPKEMYPMNGFDILIKLHLFMDIGLCFCNKTHSKESMVKVFFFRFLFLVTYFPFVLCIYPVIYVCRFAQVTGPDWLIPAGKWNSRHITCTHGQHPNGLFRISLPALAKFIMLLFNAILTKQWCRFLSITQKSNIYRLTSIKQKSDLKVSDWYVIVVVGLYYRSLSSIFFI